MTRDKLMPDDKKPSDRTAVAEIEGRDPAKGLEQPPAAATPETGSQADPSLINPDATPGTGSLPDPVSGGDADPGAG